MPFPFLKLPPELRDRVYELLLIHDRPITPDVLGSLYRRHPDLLPHVPQGTYMILKTCKTVHEEACNVLYGKNEFAFDDYDHCCTKRNGTIAEKDVDKDEALHSTDIIDLPFFLQAIGARNRSRIRKILLAFYDYIFFQCSWEPKPAIRAFGGQYLAKAFQLLSEDHSLVSLNIVFKEYTTKYLCDLSELFLWGETVVKHLRNIKGIKEILVVENEYLCDDEDDVAERVEIELNLTPYTVQEDNLEGHSEDLNL